MILDHFVNLPNQPVTKPSTLPNLRSGLQETLPLNPTPVADAISSALNIFCGAWIGPSGTAQIELMTIEWLRQLTNPANATVYFSCQTHSSVAKGLKILGFQHYQLRKIPSDENFCLPMDALAQKIAADRLQGLVPFCVVANVDLPGKSGGTRGRLVIPPKMQGFWCRAHAAICCFICRFSFWAGVMPPKPMLGRSLL